MSTELVDFLRARLDEDAEAAQIAALAAGGEHWYAHAHQIGRRAPKEWVGASTDPARSRSDSKTIRASRQELTRYIARHDPARVLAEVEAKQRILDEHQPDRFGDCVTCADEETFDDDHDGNREWSRSAKTHPCPTLRLLALTYASHPDYRSEWAP
jgi:hypothetical protein